KHQAILVAKAGEEIVGCIQADMRKILVFRRGERGLIYNLYVKRLWRRRGIGRQLMDEAISWIKNKGGEIVFLNVASQNEEARQFYDQLGFKTVNANMYRLI
ncbi:MAG: GNAT family N-acetyltransferase, partial [Chloroflexi bacterium]|nr:GNAT family N-acetyltransferase [Chloroflexota bacterium]